MKTKPQSGQAVIEAAMGLSFVVAGLSVIFGYLLLSWTYFVVDSTSETLAVCIAETRSTPSCLRKTQTTLSIGIPWAKAERLSGSLSLTRTGILQSESEIKIRMKLEGPWAETYQSRRKFCEKKQKMDSHWSALCS